MARSMVRFGHPAVIYFGHFPRGPSHAMSKKLIIAEKPSVAADIARARNVAETTVRKQIANIFRKLDVHRQVDLVRLLAGPRG